MDVNIYLFTNTDENIFRKNRGILKMGEELKIEIGKILDDSLENNPGNANIMANFLSDLFIQYKKIYGKEYGCSPIKIHKMLLILQIYYTLKYGKNTILDGLDKIEIYNCGLKLHQIYLPENITSSLSFTDKPIDIDENTFEKLQNIKRSNNLNSFNSLTPQQKKVCIILFSVYADYNPYKLGQILDKFKDDSVETGNIIEIDDFVNLIFKAKENNKIDKSIVEFANRVERFNN